MLFLGRLGVETSPERSEMSKNRDNDLFDCIEEVELTEAEVDDNLRAAGYDPAEVRRGALRVVADAVERTVFRTAAAAALPGTNCWARPIPEILVALQAAGVDPTPLREEARAARERFVAAQERFRK